MKGLKRNSLINNFSSLSLIQVTNFILSLVVIPFVIIRVGPDGFGVIAVAQVLIFYLSGLTDYGFNRTATRDIALSSDDTDKVSRIFSTVLVTKLILSVACFLILMSLALLIPFFRENLALYLLAFSFVLGQVFLINWFFQGLEKMHYIALAGLFSRLLFVGLVFGFIRQKPDNALYLFFMGIGNMVAGLICIFFVIRKYRLKYIPPPKKAIVHELREGWPLTLTNLSMITCQYSGIFILRVFSNDLLVGYYSIAEKIYFGMKLMLDVFSQVAYPRVCILVQTGKKQVAAFFRQYYIPFLLLVISCSAIIFLFSAPLIKFFAGHENAYSAFLLRMLCIATVIVCLNIPAQLMILAANHQRSYLRIFTIGMIINVVANIVLANYFDATGTVVAVLVTEFFIATGLYFELNKLYGRKPGENK